MSYLDLLDEEMENQRVHVRERKPLSDTKREAAAEFYRKNGIPYTDAMIDCLLIEEYYFIPPPKNSFELPW